MFVVCCIICFFYIASFRFLVLIFDDISLCLTAFFYLYWHVAVDRWLRMWVPVWVWVWLWLNTRRNTTSIHDHIMHPQPYGDFYVFFLVFMVGEHLSASRRACCQKRSPRLLLLSAIWVGCIRYPWRFDWPYERTIRERRGFIITGVDKLTQKHTRNIIHCHKRRHGHSYSGRSLTEQELASVWGVLSTDCRS